jgi:hypothetical protein
MNTLFKQINGILIDWDPIGVGEDIAATEYIMYIPAIIRHSKSEVELMSFLKQLITKEMGLKYNNNLHADLLLVCQNLLNATKTED